MSALQTWWAQARESLLETVAVMDALVANASEPSEPLQTNGATMVTRGDVQQAVLVSFLLPRLCTVAVALQGCWDKSLERVLSQLCHGREEPLAMAWSQDRECWVSTRPWTSDLSDRGFEWECTHTEHRRDWYVRIQETTDPTPPLFPLAEPSTASGAAATTVSTSHVLQEWKAKQVAKPQPPAGAREPVPDEKKTREADPRTQGETLQSTSQQSTPQLPQKRKIISLASIF